jgi:hypothetical protein
MPLEGAGGGLDKYFVNMGIVAYCFSWIAPTWKSLILDLCSFAEGIPSGVLYSSLYALRSTLYPLRSFAEGIPSGFLHSLFSSCQRYYILSGISIPSNSMPLFTIPETTLDKINLKFRISAFSSLSIE